MGFQFNIALWQDEFGLAQVEIEQAKSHRKHYEQKLEEQQNKIREEQRKVEEESKVLEVRQ